MGAGGGGGGFYFDVGDVMATDGTLSSCKRMRGSSQISVRRAAGLFYTEVKGAYGREGRRSLDGVHF
jgi:hypothetical protein